MRLIDRYMLREFLQTFLYCLLAFVLLRVVFEMFNTLRDFLDCHSSPAIVTQYYLLILPGAVATALPVALFFGLLFALVTLSKNNELLAFRAVGISVPRACSIAILASILCSGAMFSITEVLVPTANEEADQLLSYEETKHKVEVGKLQSVQAKIIKNNLTYVNHLENRRWRFGNYNPKTLSGENVDIQWRRGPKNDLTISARFAYWVGDHWLFQKVKLINYGAAPMGEDVVQSVKDSWEDPMINDPPEDIILFDKKEPGFMSIAQLRRYLELHPKDRLAPFRMNLEQRYAYPWACVVACLMAIPLGAGSGRRSSAVGVAAAFGLFMIYFALNYVCNRLGRQGTMDATIAAWLGNGIFTFIGAILIWRVR